MANTGERKKERKHTHTHTCPGEAGYQSCMKSGQWWNMPRIFSASSHTTSTAQSQEQPSWHKESHTVAAHTKNHYCYG